MLERWEEAKESAGDNGDGEVDERDGEVEIREDVRRGRGSGAIAWFVGGDMVGLLVDDAAFRIGIVIVWGFDGRSSLCLSTAAVWAMRLKSICDDALNVAGNGNR